MPHHSTQAAAGQITSPAPCEKHPETWIYLCSEVWFTPLTGDCLKAQMMLQMGPHPLCGTDTGKTALHVKNTSTSFPRVQQPPQLWTLKPPRTKSSVTCLQIGTSVKITVEKCWAALGRTEHHRHTEMQNSWHSYPASRLHTAYYCTNYLSPPLLEIPTPPWETSVVNCKSRSNLKPLHLSYLPLCNPELFSPLLMVVVSPKSPRAQKSKPQNRNIILGTVPYPKTAITRPSAAALHVDLEAPWGKPCPHFMWRRGQHTMQSTHLVHWQLGAKAQHPHPLPFSAPSSMPAATGPAPT